MNKEVFKEEVLKLKDAYGDDSYPKACITAMWEELKHVPDYKFKKAINRILAENVNRRWPPGVDKIERVIATIQDEIHERKVEEKRLVPRDGKEVDIRDFKAIIEQGRQEARDGKS